MDVEASLSCPGLHLLLEVLAACDGMVLHIPKFLRIRDLSQWLQAYQFDWARVKGYKDCLVSSSAVLTIPISAGNKTGIMY